MQRFIMAATLLLALGLGLFVDRSTSAQDAFSCDDFSTFDEAFSAFVEAGGPQTDPNGVDPDRDGFPCEDLEGAPEEARSSATNVFPVVGGTFVGSGAADQGTTSTGTTFVGSEANATSPGSGETTAVVDGSFVGSAAQSDDEDGDDSNGIGSLVGSAAQSDDDDEPVAQSDDVDGPETAGLGTLVGSEGAWTDGSETGETVASMPSTGTGTAGLVPSMLAMSVIALFSVLALGTGTLSLVRIGRR